MQIHKFISTIALNSLLIVPLVACAIGGAPSLPDSLPSHGFHITVHGGFFINHRPYLARLQQQHAAGFELGYLFPISGKKIWQYQFHYPTIGLAYTYLATGSPDYLGKAHAVMPYLHFPLYHSRTNQLYIKAGAGLGWMSKVFHPYNNYKNIAIGSHVNAAITLRVSNELSISPYHRVAASIGIMHWSNGSFRTPNLGINMGLASISYTYYMSYNKIQKVVADTAALPRTNISAALAAFPKEIYPALGPTYASAVFTVDVERQWNVRTFYTIGLDVFYDNSLPYRTRTEKMKNNFFLDNSRVGLHASMVKKLDRFEMWFQMGYYLHNQLSEVLNVYHRVGVRHYVSRKMFVCFNLKTHFAQADNAELGLGYKF